MLVCGVEKKAIFRANFLCLSLRIGLWRFCFKRDCTVRLDEFNWPCHASYSYLSQTLCHSIMSNEGRTARTNEAELHVKFPLQP